MTKGFDDVPREHTCRRCGGSFSSPSRCVKYCPPCVKIVAKEWMARYRKERRAKQKAGVR